MALLLAALPLLPLLDCCAPPRSDIHEPLALKHQTVQVWRRIEQLQFVTAVSLRLANTKRCRCGEERNLGCYFLAPTNQTIEILDANGRARQLAAEREGAVAGIDGIAHDFALPPIPLMPPLPRALAATHPDPGGGHVLGLGLRAQGLGFRG